MDNITASRAMREDAPPLKRQERFVALLDILGFRRMVEGNELNVVVDRMRYVHMMVNVGVGLSTMYPRADKKSRCHHVVYSDSVLIYTDGTDLADFDAILLATTQTLALSMMMGVLMRGALVRGELYVGPRERIIMGNALTQAYELEQRQQWSGAIIDLASLTEVERTYLRLDREPPGWVMSWEVPWEENGKSSLRPSLVIGWPTWFTRDDFAMVEDNVKDLLPNPDARALAKQKATSQFLAAHRAKHPRKPWLREDEMTDEQRAELQAIQEQVAAGGAGFEKALKESGLTLGEFVERNLYPLGDD